MAHLASNLSSQSSRSGSSIFSEVTADEAAPSSDSVLHPKQAKSWIEQPFLDGACKGLIQWRERVLAEKEDFSSFSSAIKSVPFSIFIRVITEIAAGVLIVASLVETAVRGSIFFVIWGTNIVSPRGDFKERVHKASIQWLEGTLHSLVNSISQIFLAVINPFSDGKPAKVITKMINAVVIPSLDWSMTSLMLMNNNANRAFSYGKLPVNSSTDIQLSDVSTHWQTLLYKSLQFRDSLAEGCLKPNFINKVGLFVGRVGFEAYLGLITGIAVLELIGRAILGGIAYGLSYIMPTQNLRNALGHFGRNQLTEARQIWNFLKIQGLVLGTNLFEDQMLYTGFSDAGKGYGFVDSRFYNALKECPYSNLKTEFSRFIKAHAQRFIENADISDYFQVLKDSLYQIYDLNAAMHDRGGKPVMDAIRPLVNGLARAQDYINESEAGRNALSALLGALLTDMPPYEQGQLNIGIEALLKGNIILGNENELPQIIERAGFEFRALAERDPEFVNKLLELVPDLLDLVKHPERHGAEDGIQLFRAIRDHLGSVESLENLLGIVVRIFGGQEQLLALIKKGIRILELMNSDDPTVVQGKELLERLGGHAEVAEWIDMASTLFGEDGGLIHTLQRALAQAGHSEDVLDFIARSAPMIHRAVAQMGRVVEGDSERATQQRRIQIGIRLIYNLLEEFEGPDRMISLLDLAVSVLGEEEALFDMLKRAIHIVAASEGNTTAAARVAITELGEDALVEQINHLISFFGNEKEIVDLLRLGLRAAGNSPDLLALMYDTTPLFLGAAEEIKRVVDGEMPVERRARQLDCVLYFVDQLLRAGGGAQQSVDRVKQLLLWIENTQEPGTLAVKNALQGLGGARRIIRLIDQVCDLFGNADQLAARGIRGGRAFAQSPLLLDFVENALPLIDRLAHTLAQDAEVERRELEAGRPIPPHIQRRRRLEVILPFVERLTGDRRLLEMLDLSIATLGGEEELIALLQRAIQSLHASDDPLLQEARQTIGNLGGPERVNGLILWLSHLYGDDRELVNTVRRAILEVGMQPQTLHFIRDALPFIAEMMEGVAAPHEAESAEHFRDRQLDAGMRIAQVLVHDDRFFPSVDVILQILGGEPRAVLLLKQTIRTIAAYQGEEARQAQQAIARLGTPDEVCALIDRICALFGNEVELVGTARRAVTEVRARPQLLDVLRGALPLILRATGQIEAEEGPQRQQQIGLELVQQLLSQFNGPETLIEILDTFVDSMVGPDRAVGFLLRLVEFLDQSAEPHRSVIQQYGGAHVVNERIRRYVAQHGAAEVFEEIKARLRQLGESRQLMSFMRDALPAMNAAAAAIQAREELDRSSDSALSSQGAEDRRAVDAGVAMVEALFANLEGGAEGILGLLDETIAGLGGEEATFQRIKALVRTIAASEEEAEQATQARARIAALGGPDNIERMINEISDLVHGDVALVALLRRALHQIVSSPQRMEVVMGSIRPIFLMAARLERGPEGETPLQKRQRVTVGVVTLVEHLTQRFGADRIVDVLNTLVTTVGGEEAAVDLLCEVIRRIPGSEVAQTAEAQALIAQLGGPETIVRMVHHLANFLGRRTEDGTIEGGSTELIHTIRRALQQVGGSPATLDFLRRGLPMIMARTEAMAAPVAGEAPAVTQRRQITQALDLVHDLITEFGGSDPLIIALDHIVTLFEGEARSLALLRQLIENLGTTEEVRGQNARRLIENLGGPERVNAFITDLIDQFGTERELINSLRRGLHVIGANPEVMDFLRRGVPLMMDAANEVAREVEGETPEQKQGREVGANLDLIHNLMVTFQGPERFLSLLDTAIGIVGSEERAYGLMMLMIRTSWRGSAAEWRDFERAMGTFGRTPAQFFAFARNVIRVFGRETEQTIPVLKQIIPVFMQADARVRARHRAEVEAREAEADAANAEQVPPVMDANETFDMIEGLLEETGGPGPLLALLDRALGAYESPVHAFAQIRDCIAIFVAEGQREQALHAFDRLFGEGGIPPEQAIALVQNVIRALAAHPEEEGAGTPHLARRLAYLRQIAIVVEMTCQGRDALGINEVFSILEAVLSMPQQSMDTLRQVIRGLGGPDETVALARHVIARFAPDGARAADQFDQGIRWLGGAEGAVNILLGAIDYFGQEQHRAKIPAIRRLASELSAVMADKQIGATDVIRRLGTLVPLLKDVIQILGGHANAVHILDRVSQDQPKNRVGIIALQGYIRLLQAEAAGGRMLGRLFGRA